MSTESLSFHVDAATLAGLAARSRETGEPELRLARRYIEEGLRLESHPGIVFRDGPTGRRAALAHGPDVWEIARVIGAVEARGGAAIEESVELTGRTPSEIRAVARYYEQYRGEIDDWIRRVDEEAERAEAAWLREQR